MENLLFSVSWFIKDSLAFIQGLFQDLITKFKELIFSGTRIILSQILHILNSCANKPIPISANNILKPKDNSFFRVN